MPCRDTGHHFSALGCGQATKIVMRRGGGPELCVDEVSGVENRQVVSPPPSGRASGWAGLRTPSGRGLSRRAFTGRASSRASLHIPIQQGLVLRERRVIGEEIRIPIWQGSHPAGSIAQSSHRATFSRAGLPGVGEHPRPDANWSADENLDNFGAGAVN